MQFLIADMNRAERVGFGARLAVVGAVLLLAVGLVLCTVDGHHHMPGHSMSPELCNWAWLSPEIVVLIVPLGTAARFAELKQSFSAVPVQRIDPPPRSAALAA